jgi:hypothetical protein
MKHCDIIDVSGVNGSADRYRWGVLHEITPANAVVNAKPSTTNAESSESLSYGKVSEI